MSSSTSVVFSQMAPILELKEKCQETILISSQEDKSIYAEFKGSIIERVNHSIELTEEEFKLFEKNLIEKMKKEVPVLREQELEFEEQALKILKKSLDDWEQTNFDDIPKSILNSYIKEIEALKVSYLESQEDRFKERCKEVKREDKQSGQDKRDFESKSKKEIDLTVQKNMESLKSFLVKITQKFLKLSFKDLNETFAIWNKMNAHNKNLKKPFDKKKDKFAMEGTDMLLELRNKIKNLYALSEQLTKMDFKQVPLRIDFFKNKEQHQRDKHGNNPLHYCCLFDDYELAKELDNLRVKKNVKNENQYLPFHFVIRNSGNTRKFLELLKPSYEDLCAKDPEGRTSFEAAAFYGNYAALEWMIKIAILAKDFNILSLKTAFTLACEKEHENIVGMLLSLIRESMPFSELLNICFEACVAGKVKVAVIFFKCGVSPGFELQKKLNSLTHDQLQNVARCYDAIEKSSIQLKNKLEKLYSKEVVQKSLSYSADIISQAMASP